MDENNTYINKSEKEALEIMENVSDITSDQLQALRENEECFCSGVKSHKYFHVTKILYFIYQIRIYITKYLL